MSGMGRCGSLHVWQQADVVPDIQTVAKGLGGGYAPIAGLLINKRVTRALECGSGYARVRANSVRQKANMNLGPSPTVTHIKVIRSLARLLLKFSGSSKTKTLFPTFVKQENFFASAFMNTLIDRKSVV